MEGDKAEYNHLDVGTNNRWNWATSVDLLHLGLRGSSIYRADLIINKMIGLTPVDGIKEDLEDHMDEVPESKRPRVDECTEYECTAPLTSSDDVFKLGSTEVHLHMTSMLRKIFLSTTTPTTPSRGEIFNRLCIVAVGDSEHAEAVWTLLMDTVNRRRPEGSTECILRGSPFTTLFCTAGFCLKRLKREINEWPLVDPSVNPDEAFPPRISRACKLAIASLTAHPHVYTLGELNTMLRDCLIVAMHPKSKEIIPDIPALVELILETRARLSGDILLNARKLGHIARSIDKNVTLHTPLSIMMLAPLAFILAGAKEMIEDDHPIFGDGYRSSPVEYVVHMCMYLSSGFLGAGVYRKQNLMKFTDLFSTLAPFILRDEPVDARTALELAQLREMLEKIKTPKGLQRSVRVERWKTALSSIKFFLEFQGKAMEFIHNDPRARRDIFRRD